MSTIPTHNTGVHLHQFFGIKWNDLLCDVVGSKDQTGGTILKPVPCPITGFVFLKQPVRHGLPLPD